MDSSKSIWDRFDMGFVKQIRFAQNAPRIHSIKPGADWPTPDLICEFMFGGHGSIPVWGTFSDYGPSPHVFSLTGAGDDLAVVADAVGVAQHYHFFPPSSRNGHEDMFRDIASIPVHAIAAYQASAVLQNNYPWLHLFLTQKTPNGGYVYLLDDQQGHYKIGRSVNVNSRLTQLRTQPPFAIEVLAAAWMPDCKAEEKRLHQQHTERRLKGEWFALPQDHVKDLTSYLNHVFELGDKMSRMYTEHDFADWREIEAHPYLWFISPEEAKDRTREFSMVEGAVLQ